MVPSAACCGAVVSVDDEPLAVGFMALMGDEEVEVDDWLLLLVVADDTKEMDGCSGDASGPVSDSVEAGGGGAVVRDVAGRGASVAGGGVEWSMDEKEWWSVVGVLKKTR